MELHWDEKGIRIQEKVLNIYDEFALAFTEILEQAGIRYVLLSGYVAILFGRSRQTEDLDMVVESLDEERFRNLWGLLTQRFECLNTDDATTAYREYLAQKTALRFSMPGEYLPNMEFKIAAQPLERMALQQRLPVILDQGRLYIGPIEEQIAFKVFLGSEKDIEDAKHLYLVCKEHLNTERLRKALDGLRQRETARRHGIPQG